MSKNLTIQELNKHLPQEYQTLIEWRADGLLTNETETTPNFSLFCKQHNLKILDWTTNLTNQIVNQALKKCHD